jgi:hypothetical protein
MVYCNGSTDYVELYGYVGTGQILEAQSKSTYFQAAFRVQTPWTVKNAIYSVCERRF